MLKTFVLLILIGIAGCGSNLKSSFVQTWFPGVETVIEKVDPGPPAIHGRFIFYNNSSFFGESAIAPDKTPLFPGQTATFANYTSYSKGLNGIIIDIVSKSPLTYNDFEFIVGNRLDLPWVPAPVATQIKLYPGKGSSHSDRYVILWADNAIQKQWLKITVKNTANTGLLAPDVFYFGNAIGDTGYNTAKVVVNVDAADQVGVRNHNMILEPNDLGLSNQYDFNRDGIVNNTDEVISRVNSSTLLNALRYITAP